MGVGDNQPSYIKHYITTWQICQHEIDEKFEKNTKKLKFVSNDIKQPIKKGKYGQNGQEKTRRL